uniref:SFRICE_024036 n=1 Tax=Spodoptera frugiperda TaxID=7108 RepID=A0A2H1WQX5_SPOFR
MEQVEPNFLKEQIFDDLLQYQDLEVSHLTTTAELLPNQVLSRVLSSYKEFVDKTRQGDHGKTAQFYMTYIQLVNYYITLSRSIRMGDFEMFKHIIPKITNLFFIVNQPNYARWCVKYYDNLQNVDKTHPGLEEEFKSGCFGIKRTDKSFSRIPVDLTLEQTINADAARRLSGIAHFTNSIAARQRWTKTHSIRAALISHVLDRLQKRKKILRNKIVELRLQRDLFGRMLGISLTHKVDIKRVLTFPLTPVPTSMCHTDGSICKTDKSQLMKLIEKKIGDNVDRPPPCFDLAILDGFFMLHLMKEVPVTFDSLSKNFLSMILRFKSNRVDIVFDQYFTPSIKDFERTRRDELTRPVTIGPNQIRPHNFIAELKNINFKEAPVHFLLTIGLCYSYRVESNKVIKTLEDSLSCEEHEEADSRIIYHICQINVDAEVMIRCSDTDILIILLGNMDHFNASLTLWVNLGVGNHERLISANKIHEILGSSVSKALPCFHALTGCDYTPAFFRKGKLRPFKILEQSEQYQTACQNIITDDEELLDETFKTLEKFICHIYGARDSWNVNEVRFQMFANTYRSKKSEDNLKKKIVTLTHPAYRHHLLRVRYVTKFWTNAYLKHPTSLSPQASGWTMNNNKYDFIWFDGEQLPSLVADIIIKDNNLLENDNNTKDDDDNESDSSDEDDYQDSPVLVP